MTRTFSLLLAATLLVGCDEPTGPSGFEFIIQVRAISEPTAPPSSVGPARADGVESIDIDEAVVVLAGITLDGTQNPDWTLNQTVVVPLRLSGSPTLAFAPAAEEGEYQAIRIAVDELDPDNPDEADLIDVFPRLEGLSVLVSGTLVRNGTPESFLFTTADPAVAELVFAQPRRFNAQAYAIAVYTLRFDLDRWFETPGGILLDPNDQADREEIEFSILGTMEIVSGSGN